MTKEQIISYFYEQNASYGIKNVFFILLFGLLAGMVIYLTYYITSEKVTYNRKFNWSLVAFLLITVIIMLVISTNIAMSLGMVGALSIVRFRTAVKDSRDTVFIFWAMAEGLCASSQNYRLTMISVLFIATVFIASSKIPGIFNRYLLIVGGGVIDKGEFQQKLKPFVVSQRIRTVNRDVAHEEWIVEIKTKGEFNLDALDELLTVSGVEKVNAVVESGETVG